ncbi:unnamed protein product [Onchocerca ochengi]|uniref:RRM domain-containing protein n=1 Tax=Onchocerca ochengi TaxID=42157 RepID=A0A182E8F7_ONCOC|nr:unnamed protein product [Onchocerca ochengi]
MPPRKSQDFCNFDMNNLNGDINDDYDTSTDDDFSSDNDISSGDEIITDSDLERWYYSNLTNSYTTTQVVPSVILLAPFNNLSAAEMQCDFLMEFGGLYYQGLDVAREGR